MLTANYLHTVADAVLELFSQFEDRVIIDIARRLGKLRFESAAWQMQRLTESGALYDNVIGELAKLTGRSRTELRKIFKEAGVKSIAFDDKIYRKAGLNPVPLNLSPAMTQVMESGLLTTFGYMNNLTSSIAQSVDNLFVEAADLAWLEVSTGAFSYNEAIKHAVLDLADKGIKTVTYPGGRQDHIDVAMRRSVLTGVSQTTGKVQEMRITEMGVELVQTSAHIGARNKGVGPMNHESWQGRVFSVNPNNKNYPDFVETTGYGTGAGLMGWNCRHSYYPFFEGISQNAYDEETLSEYANQKVMYHGETMTVYDATQKQRYIEQNIRDWKRKADSLGAAGLDNSTEVRKVSEWQGRMREFIRETGLSRDRIREQVPGASRIFTGVKKPEYTPESAPVSAALRVSTSPHTGVIKESVEIIDSVHGGTGLPMIRVRNANVRENGFFSRGKQYPREIAIRTENNPMPHVSLFHEVGHLLDFSGIGTQSKFASIGDPLLDGWRYALMKSNAYRNLVAHRFRIEQGALWGNTDQLIYARYITSLEEFWARSYAQYIATKSDSIMAKLELNLILQNDKLGTHWQEDDFTGIFDAIDKLFKDLGWIK
jgi:DNA-directed RNA polymerase subunit F